MKKFIILISLLVAAPAQAATILSSDFSSRSDTLAQGWALGRTNIDEATGELFSPNDAGSFAEATYDFASPLDLDDGAVTVTWVERWVSNNDRQYAEKAKTFIDLDIFKRDAGGLEDFELKANIRPLTAVDSNQNRYYHLYLDPGFEQTHIADAFLEPPTEQISAPQQSPDQLFSYRMRAEKNDSTVLATLEYFADGWQTFNSADIDPTLPDFSSGENSIPLMLDIANDLRGKDSFESLQLRFGSPGYAFFDSVLVEQATTSEENTDQQGEGNNDSEAVSPQTVPESSAWLGLLGAAGLAITVWRKSTNALTEI